MILYKHLLRVCQPADRRVTCFAKCEAACVCPNRSQIHTRARRRNSDRVCTAHSACAYERDVWSRTRDQIFASCSDGRKAPTVTVVVDGTTFAIYNWTHFVRPPLRPVSVCECVCECVCAYVSSVSRSCLFYFQLVFRSVREIDARALAAPVRDRFAYCVEFQRVRVRTLAQQHVFHCGRRES